MNCKFSFEYYLDIGYYVFRVGYSIYSSKLINSTLLYRKIKRNSGLGHTKQSFYTADCLIGPHSFLT